MDPAVREGRDGGVVRDEDERGAALAPEVDEDVEDRGAGRAVEVSRRLVGEEERRAGSEGARERDPLLLAAGELRRVVVAALPEADGREEVRRALAGVGVARQLERQEDVLPGRHVGEELVRLEDEADLPPPEEREVVLGHGVDRSPVEEDLAARGAVEAGHEAEERRLAAARRAQDGGELARADAEVDVVEDPEHPVPGRELFREAAQLEEGSHDGRESRTPVTSAAVRCPVFLALALSASFLAACGRATRCRNGRAEGPRPAEPGRGSRGVGAGGPSGPGAAPRRAGGPVRRPPRRLPRRQPDGGARAAGRPGVPGRRRRRAREGGPGGPGRERRASRETRRPAGLRRADWVLSQRPDVVVLALGANDGLRGLPPAETERNLRGIVAKARSAGARVLLCGMLVPTSYGPEYQAEFGRLFPRVAKAEGVPLVPFLLEGVAGRKELNLEDGIHPNAEGQRVVAANVLAHLEPLLPPAPR